MHTIALFNSLITRHLKKREILRIVGICLGLLGLSGVANATQYEASGTIGSIRSYAASYGGASLEDVTTFQVTPGVAVANGCAWLYVGANDANLLSQVLSAKVTGATITVWYDPTVTSPWGDPSTCLAEVFQLN
jgi:hypothetical protein